MGNHDGNLKNSTRQDALSPIVKALDLPALHLPKNAGEPVLEPAAARTVLGPGERRLLVVEFESLGRRRMRPRIGSVTAAVDEERAVVVRR